MTLDEAVKLLEKTPVSVLVGNNLNYDEARQLGIEALKRLKAQRLHGFDLMAGGLPSETKE